MKKLLGLFIASFSVMAACLACADPAAAGSVVLRPNSDPPSSAWSVYDGSWNWQAINQTSESTSNYICRGSGSAFDLYGLSDEFVGQGVTSITVRAYAALGRTLLLIGNDQIGLSASIDGSLVGPIAASVPSSNLLSLLPSCPGSLLDLLSWTNYGWLTPASYTGFWTQEQIDGMELYLSKIQNGTSEPVRVARAEAVVDYIDPPVLYQNVYRIYENVNSSNPGSPMSDTNTKAEISSGGSGAFRLRIGTNVQNGESWRSMYGSMRLEYTQKNSGTCNSSTGWSSVNASSGPIRWNTNSTVTDGSAISSYPDDPVSGSALIYQQYRESNDFFNPSAVSVSDTALWDFSLVVADGSPGQSYCFRIANSSGSITIVYSQIPEITLVGNLGISVVDSLGSIVNNPTVGFSPVVTMWECQQTTGILGINNQRIRVTNDLVDNGWSVSITPTNGSSATWSSHNHSYAFNQSSGSPPGCDSGQLSLKPSAATISPKSGCSSTGLSLGSDASFEQGSVEIINLVTASTGSEKFCYWDITNIHASQRIPAMQPAGIYRLDLTITVVAL